jgi:hypothetical protein
LPALRFTTLVRFVIAFPVLAVAGVHETPAARVDRRRPERLFALPLAIFMPFEIDLARRP